MPKSIEDAHQATLKPLRDFQQVVDLYKMTVDNPVAHALIPKARLAMLIKSYGVSPLQQVTFSDDPDQLMVIIEFLRQAEEKEFVPDSTPIDADITVIDDEPKVVIFWASTKEPNGISTVTIHDVNHDFDEGAELFKELNLQDLITLDERVYQWLRM